MRRLDGVYAGGGSFALDPASLAERRSGNMDGRSTGEEGMLTRMSERCSLRMDADEERVELVGREAGK